MACLERRWWILCVVLMQVAEISADTGYFWHITDFHYDYSYHDSQLSCNRDNRPSTPGQYGDFWCDSPWALVKNSIAAMTTIKPDVDFLIWTGDTVLHASDDELNYNIKGDILDNVTEALKSAFPGRPVYATFGNHDFWPNDQFPPNNDRFYNDSLARWRDWIGDTSQDETFRQGGYYTMKTSSGLRMVVLNTNLYYTTNKAVLTHSDPAGQFKWLEQVLKDADKNNEKVLITGHIPPGVHTPSSILWMYKEYNDRLVSILQNYINIIPAMHFGHDHVDGFKILPTKAGQPGCPIFIAPSVTPWRYVIPDKIGPAHNPGIRLVKFDKQTGRHLAIQQYYLDLVQANKDGAAIWKQEYNTSGAYSLIELTAANMKLVTEKMHTANSEEFQNYWKFYTVSPPGELLEKCDDVCHASIVCGFTEFNMADFAKCKSKMTSGVISIHKPSFGLVGLLAIVYVLF